MSMSKNYIHDIKPSSRAQKRREVVEREHELRMRKLGIKKNEDFGSEEYEYSGGGRSGRGIWYIAALAIIVLVFALTFVFAGATVYVTPREGTVELSGPIVAEKESRTGLSYEMVSASAEKSSSVSASEKKYVEKKATGMVRIYNNNSTAPQKLLIDTRLESPNGYIYKTKTAVVVPGQTTVKGKLTPGTVDVAIYADEAGEVYNQKELDLKIVGFRGGPKYEKIYAKTITPVEGGFKGDSYDISDTEKETVMNSLKADLTADLIAKARTELPADFIMYDKAVDVTFDEPVFTDGESGKAEISVKGNINAYIFKESELTKALVEKVIAKSEENSVSIPNIRELNIELDKPGSMGGESDSDIKIVIEDKVNVVWNINDAELKEALSGTRKRDFDSKMLNFKNIESAELSLKPFWRTTFPDKPGAIKIVNTFTDKKVDVAP